MASFASLADYYRHHRLCMERAMAEGITPRAAEIELRREEALEKHRRLMAGFEANRARERAAAAPSEPAEEPWWRRD